MTQGCTHLLYLGIFPVLHKSQLLNLPLLGTLEIS